MSINHNSPITIVEGIGPATATKLAKIGIFSVFDLLRADAHHIHAAVQASTSIEQVQSWLDMVQLLKAAPMTPQWAEGLVVGGVSSLFELYTRPVQEITAAFQNAKDAGVIPDVPTAAEVTEMRLDAAVLHHTGALLGTVADSATGAPLSGAQVALAHQETQTDSRGRFQIFRIPLGRVHPLTIRQPGYAVMHQTDVPVLVGNTTASTSTFRLTAADADASDISKALYERNGDTVPVPNGQPMRQQTLDAAMLPDHELLMVRFLYKNRTDANLVTRFKTYIDGQFFVYAYRVPLSRLPDGIQPQDHVKFEQGNFQKVRLDLEDLRMEIARRRFSKHLKSITLPLAVDQRGFLVADQVNQMIQRGLLHGIH